MLGIGPGDHLLQTSALVFDASLRQLLAPLRAGRGVHTTTRAERREPAHLRARLAREAITHLNTSPALLARVVAAGGEAAPALRQVTVGGEALAVGLARAVWTAFGPVELWNLYGPTEATINATAHRVEPADDPVPIGRPLPGYQVWVLDEAGRPAEEGELCVGGVGVFAGYLGDEPVPWVETPDGSRAYRTGDRARWRADKALLYRGRVDDQVQIRGVRVEPGEIEAVLAGAPGVRLAAVRRVEGAGDAWLEAWIEGAAEAEAVRAHAMAHLPAAMVPRRVHSVERLPLGPTGKVDRSTLVAGPAPTRASRGALPATPAEQPGGGRVDRRAGGRAHRGGRRLLRPRWVTPWPRWR
ncbi:MAG: AMP-binding protein [bacterium]